MYMILNVLYYGQRNYVLKWDLIYVIRNINVPFTFYLMLTLTLQIIRIRVQIWDRCSLECFAMRSADFTCVDGPTMQEMYRTFRLSLNFWVFE